MRRTRTRTACVLAAVVMSSPAAAVTSLQPAGAAVDQQATMTATAASSPASAEGGEPAVSTVGTDATPTSLWKAAAELRGDLVFTPPSGTFQGSQTVALATGVTDAEIRYTTDGQVPTETSPRYTEALSLTRTTQVRAQAFVDGRPSGAMGSAVYVARAFDATHDLPLLVLDAYGGGRPDKTQYKDVAALVMDPRGGTTGLGRSPAVATRAGFRMRGQSSSHFEKLPYRFEFWDNENGEADYPVLGMPADGDWALRVPFPDKTLMRDAFAYDTGRAMGLGAPRYRFVEVYLNLDDQPMSADDYQGVFLLVETVKRSKDRVDVAKLKVADLTEPEVSGGYIMQFNWGVAEQPTLSCTRVTRQSPCWSDLELLEPNDPQPEQKAWITNYVQRFHDALRGANPSDPETGYPAYIDVDSFVNQIVHNEMSLENDAYSRSTHFFKDRDGKLVVGPLWDYDLAYGTLPPSGGGIRTSGWQYQSGGASDWFRQLMRDPAFQAKVAARWQELRQGVLSDEQMTARIDAFAASLSAAAERNFQRWPNLGTAKVGPFNTQVTATWDEQLSILRTFLTQRAAWLDASDWNAATASATPTPVAER